MPINQSQRILNRIKRQWIKQTDEYHSIKRQHRQLDKQLERQIQVIVVLFMAGMVLSYVYGVKTMLSWWQISRFFAGFALLTLFIPKMLLPVVYKYFKELKALLGIFGIAPFLTGCLLCANFLLAGPDYSEHYKVIRAEYFVSDQLVEIELEHNMYHDFYEMRKVRMATNAIFTPDSAKITFADGWLGIKTFRDIELKSR